MSHSSFPTRHSMSPFRKSFQLDRNEEPAIPKKPKRQSLRIITSGTDNTPSSTPSFSSPSRVRQKLSNLFRSSSPVVMTLKDSFSNNKNLERKDSSLSFVTAAEQPSSQQQTPTLLDTLSHGNNSSTTLSSSSEASDHMPASPADGTFNHPYRKSVTDPSFWQPMVNEQDPATVYQHHHYQQAQKEEEPAKPKCLLALQVQQILGSTLDEVDEEIEEGWEESRRLLRQSLVLPPAGSSSTCF